MLRETGFGSPGTSSRLRLKVGVLVGALVLSACAPAAPSPAATTVPSSAAKPAQADWQATWAQAVAAAKQEGRVVVAGVPGENYRKALTAFQESYPEIQVQFIGQSGRDLVPKIIAERQGGQFLWDVYVGGAETALSGFRPAGIIEPIRAVLIRPEIWDDSKWLNGFAWGFMDKERQLVFASGAYINRIVDVNRDVIPDGELANAVELVEPKYKGKISSDDPRFTGTGNTQATALLHLLGEEKLGKLFAEQAIVATRDIRQQAEWLVRGRYPIAIAAHESEIKTFQSQGLGLNVRPLESLDATYMSAYPSPSVLTRAPHPNAARVYLDWFLSQQGQAIWNKYNPYNSRRLDVVPADPESVPQAGVEYFVTAKEEFLPLRDRSTQMAKELLP